jgi:hypothetical protein
MKTKLASILGLALLVASFTCGSSFVYADAPEAASSAMQVLVPDADTNGAEAVDLPRMCNCDEINCTDAQTAEAGQLPSAVSEIEPSTVEPSAVEASTVEESPAPAIQSADAIIVEVTETVTVVVPGEGAADSEEPAVTGSIPAATEAAATEAAATEPAAVVEAAADASPVPATEATDAVAVEVVQTVTIAAPGQAAGDETEPAVAESTPQPSAAEPALTQDAELP